MIREAIRCVLEDTGAVRVIAETDEVAVAVELCRQLRPPVVLLEPGPPGALAWLEISQIVRVSPESRIVVLSAYEDSDSIAAALSAGAHAFVPKRATVEELLEAIRWAATGSPYVPRAISKTVFEYLRSRHDHGGPVMRPLTPRETQVCKMVAEGHSNREIGEIGGISQETVRNYRKRIMRKLGAHGVAQLTRAALRLRLVASSASHPGDGGENHLLDIRGERPGVAVPLHRGLSLVPAFAEHP